MPSSLIKINTSTLSVETGQAHADDHTTWDLVAAARAIRSGHPATDLIAQRLDLPGLQTLKHSGNCASGPSVSIAGDDRTTRTTSAPVIKRAPFPPTR